MGINQKLLRDPTKDSMSNIYQTHFSNGLALTYSNTDDNQTVNGRDSIQGQNSSLQMPNTIH